MCLDLYANALQGTREQLAAACIPQQANSPPEAPLKTKRCRST